MKEILSLLKESFSEKRLSTYENICEVKGIPVEYAVELYKLNILICEELYAFVSCIEVCIRNRIHDKMKEVAGRENWYDDIAWLEKHQTSLDDAKKTRYKTDVPDSDEIISRLSFGFWGHIFDKSYESLLWVPALRFVFPGYTGRPDRKHIVKSFNSLLVIRNRIAHFEPIIKDERELLKIYNQMVEVMNWMCPEIYNWFEGFNKFKELYTQLTTNSFIEKPKESDNGKGC